MNSQKVISLSNCFPIKWYLCLCNICCYSEKPLYFILHSVFVSSICRHYLFCLLSSSSMLWILSCQFCLKSLNDRLFVSYHQCRNLIQPFWSHVCHLHWSPSTFPHWSRSDNRYGWPCLSKALTSMLFIWDSFRTDDVLHIYFHLSIRRVFSKHACPETL